MSTPLSESDVLFEQRFLSCCGVYSGPLDGAWDAATDSASQRYYSETDRLAAELGELDPRSEKCIRSLQLVAQRPARLMIGALRQHGFDVRVISGTRTYAEQDALYAQGRTAPGKIVTKAKGGQSWHNFGLAWDIGLFVDQAYVGDGAEYAPLAPIAKEAAGPVVTWGGDWHSFKDMPHYQVGPADDLHAQARRFEAGARS